VGPRAERGAGDAGGRSMLAPGPYAGKGRAGVCVRPRVGGSIVRGMVISTVGLLIIGIICSPSFSPANGFRARGKQCDSHLAMPIS